ncbi:MAG: SUF system NifU family Fe-S cluster assembly protein [Caldilineae bacterium]|nr:MAG: SUF system NifU family Fe-S cluster assembly protein [Caldilineae bacterium]
MDDLYRENIIDHYRHPRNKGHLEDPDIHYHDVNPFCGDEITIELKLDGDRIAKAVFDGKGCAISQAAASMLTEELEGMTLEEVKHLDKQFILDMLGIPIGPVRLKCALLSLKVLKAGVYGLDEWPE